MSAVHVSGDGDTDGLHTPSPSVCSCVAWSSRQLGVMLYRVPEVGDCRVAPKLHLSDRNESSKCVQTASYRNRRRDGKDSARDRVNNTVMTLRCQMGTRLITS